MDTLYEATVVASSQELRPLGLKRDNGPRRLRIRVVEGSFVVGCRLAGGVGLHRGSQARQRGTRWQAGVLAGKPRLTGSPASCAHTHRSPPRGKTRSTLASAAPAAAVPPRRIQIGGAERYRPRYCTSTASYYSTPPHQTRNGPAASKFAWH